MSRLVSERASQRVGCMSETEDEGGMEGRLGGRLWRQGQVVVLKEVVSDVV